MPFAESNGNKTIPLNQIKAYCASGTAQTSIKRLDIPFMQKQPFCRSDSEDYSSDSASLHEFTTTKNGLHLYKIKK